MPKLNLSLYLVLDAQACITCERLLTVAEEALANGITILQLRSYHPDWTPQVWYQMAQAVKARCMHYGVPFIINNEVDIALAVDADGVHLGQNDLSPEQARKRLGARKIIGLSTHDIDEVYRACHAPIDYIGIGPIFPTSSKKDAGTAIGLEKLATLVMEKTLPSVAIGGITLDNAAAVRRVNKEGIAVISALCQASDVAGMTRKLSVL